MIRTSIEGSRGCGVRKPGGLYLVAPQLSEPCPRLPLELDRCPHCGQGVGPARGWTWITPAVLFPAQIHGSMEHNNRCPLGTEEGAHVTFGGDMHVNFANTGHRTGERAGLIWVGEKFYPTPEAFMAEAASMGVSRRIKAVPRGFTIGEDWVYLAHRKAVPVEVVDDVKIESVASNPSGSVQVTGKVTESHAAFLPGVITLFRPTAIEYVVKGDETEEEIEKLEERGIQPVKVVNTETDGISTWNAETGEPV